MIDESYHGNGGRVLSEADAALLRELMIDACVALSGELVGRQRRELDLASDGEAVRAACETIVRRCFEYNGRSYAEPSFDDVRWVVQRFAEIYVDQGAHPSVVASAIAPAVGAVLSIDANRR